MFDSNATGQTVRLPLAGEIYVGPHFDEVYEAQGRPSLSIVPGPVRGDVEVIFDPADEAAARAFIAALTEAGR